MSDSETLEGLESLFESEKPNKLQFETEKINLYNGSGYVKLIDMMPREFKNNENAETSIASGARVSTGRTSGKTKKDDENLIRRLFNDGHTSPFELVVFKFEMVIPIFVERQLVRHRTASLNEQSARYSAFKESYFFPKLRLQSKTNKQGSEEGKIDEKALKIWESSCDLVRFLHKNYEELLKMGMAREVVRCILPVSLMTKIIWQMNLHNLIKFIKLRSAPDAQKEIRDLSDAIITLIEPYVPVTIQCYRDSLNPPK